MPFATTRSIVRSLSSNILFIAPFTQSALASGVRSASPLPTALSTVCPRRLSTARSAKSAAPATTMTLAPPSEGAVAQDSVPAGPTWHLEYDSLDAPALTDDIAAADAHVLAMETSAAPLKALIPVAATLSRGDAATVDLVPALSAMLTSYWEAAVLLRNVMTQAMCVGSVDGGDAAAKKMASAIQVRLSRMRQAFEPAALLLDLCPEPLFEAVLKHDARVSDAEYVLRHSRMMARHKLSLEEENVVTAMTVTGHSAWGTMYSDLSSAISVNLRMPDGSSKPMGIASAEALRDHPDEHMRKASWEAIREAWLPHRETCAAALNAITGWRLDMYKKRQYPSFLTSVLHLNRMSNSTLDALFEAIDASTQIGRRALRLQARAFGKDGLHPWDLYAPAPVGKHVGKIYTFEEGIDLIAAAVAEVDPDAGKFVYMMRDNKWIEASRGDTKRPGAYCTGFAKSRTPRVYLSDYNGGSALLLTLAHELGHAFHSWQMRDLPQAQLNYPLNLAETASIFFETVVGNKLLENAESPEERFSILWDGAASAGAFLLNIPARYRFEEELNKRRAEGPLSVEEIDDVMVGAWKRYYGDALLDVDRVGVFSQSKLHFYITGISFYNWPYSFGYLFALGVYAEYEKGSHTSFSELYRLLLRDTGRMDAESVVEKHLGGRIDHADFWKRAISVTERKIDQLEQANAEMGKA